MIGKKGREERPHIIAKPVSPPLDPARHLATRRAMRDLLARQKVFVASRRFADGEARSARVLVAGEYYDVNETQLGQLRDGLSPADLMLEPAPHED